MVVVAALPPLPLSFTKALRHEAPTQNASLATLHPPHLAVDQHHPANSQLPNSQKQQLQLQRGTGKLAIGPRTAGRRWVSEEREGRKPGLQKEYSVRHKARSSQRLSDRDREREKSDYWVRESASFRSSGEQAGVRDGSRVELSRHVDSISSLGNAYVKHIVKLRQSSSYRHSCRSVVVVGHVPLREICEAATLEGGRGPYIECLLVLDNTEASEFIVECSKRVVRVTSAVMHKLSGMDSEAGVEAVGVLSLPASYCSSISCLTKWCPSPQRLLVLETIQDPGNLGTLVRTAAAFDWDGIILLDGCCDPFNDKALRASRGACFRIPIATVLWSQLQDFADVQNMKLYAGNPENDTCQNRSVKLRGGALHQSALDDENSVRYQFGADKIARQTDSAKPLSNSGCKLSTLQDFTNVADETAICLVLGSEGQGLSEHAKKACSLISIPMPGSFESLNVAVAGGILMFALQKDWSARESEHLDTH